MKRRLPLPILVALVALIPQVASANAGTPLMWAGMLHLVFGNAIIGIGEGLLIAWVFGRPKLRCVGLMIAANYFSAWIGGFGLVGFIAPKPDWNLYTGWRLFWVFAFGSYLITLLLEWPIVAVCFWKQKNWLRKSIKASLLVQTVSYLCLFGWYWSASGKSLYTRMEIVPATAIKLPANVKLFYIADRDGHVYEQSLQLGDVVSTNHNDRLLFREIPGVTNSWTLLLRLDAERDENVRLLPVEATVEGSLAAVDAEDGKPAGRETSFNFGPALQFGSATNGPWRFYTGFWPVEGMHAHNEQTGETLHFAWETPFSRWEIRNAIQLPDDHVIFQLGDSQVCVLEPQTKRIALLVRGRGPAVLLR